ncbi:hypothetical protein C2845_PM10G12420 [Panicum miliaceum]|uniref:F-box domain-containing protein n=1 Tax=Panicum miliaceum TaxID=4540 RepID=A0A3L6PFH1_PANMI|nr:hypothetical protein C2845_PM10G12420 [Panicum miliaceum]
MVAKRLHSSMLEELPSDVAIKITGHLAVTTERPMDDLRGLRATCRFMRRVCYNLEVGRSVATERFTDHMEWNKPDGYDALLARLTQIDNPEACFITGLGVVFGELKPVAQPCIIVFTHAAAEGHNVAAYMAAVLLYMANAGAAADDAARRYIRQVEGEEEAAAAAHQC